MMMSCLLACLLASMLTAIVDGQVRWASPERERESTEGGWEFGLSTVWIEGYEAGLVGYRERVSGRFLASRVIVLDDCNTFALLHRRESVRK